MRAWNDREMDETISNMLRLGVTLAACLVLLGGILYFFQHPGSSPDYGQFHSEPATLRNPVGICMDAIHGRASGVIQLGLLVLILTPIARVFMCVVGFLFSETGSMLRLAAWCWRFCCLALRSDIDRSRQLKSSCGSPMPPVFYRKRIGGMHQASESAKGGILTLNPRTAALMDS